jgi:hypothetical protein
MAFGPRRRAAARMPALALAAALAVVACSGGGGGGSPQPPPPPPPPPDPQFRITGVSPFAPGCDGVLPTGTVYVNAEVEPFVAVNPVNPGNVVAVWQQDRWSDGAARGIRAGASFDGGRTWTASTVPFSRCTGGSPANGNDYQRASDPWVSFGPDGTVYQIAIAVSGASQTLGSSGAVLVARSIDGGLTWEPPIALIRDIGLPFNAKESLTADATDARFVYAVWDRLEGLLGPTLFARSTDSGRTWEPARVIYDPGPNQQTINNQLVVLPDGTLVVFFTRLVAVTPTIATATLAVIRSTDKGLTWSAPIVVSPVQVRGVTDPQSGTPIRDGATLGSISAGHNGVIAAVWQDSRFSGGARDGVALSRSSDGGLTWTVPVQLNREPSVPAFLPAVHVRGDGTIGVTYYDLRSNTSEASLLTDYWLTQSSDGVTWRETRIAAAFDYAFAPFARGYFLGDYMGLSSTGTTFLPVYGLANTGDTVNRTDIFATLASTVGTAKALPEGEPAVAGPPREPLEPTPELARAFAASVNTAIERRRVGTGER